MLRKLILLCIFVLWPATGHAQATDPGMQYVSIAFHDIVDDPAMLSDDAITSDRLVAFFEWMKGNGWTAVSIDDIERARQGGKPLPPRAVLLTFDDGYRSLYTRVFPLLLAYRMPAVSGLVGAWMDAPLDGEVRYNDKTVPRRNFISWAEAREMQASGLVEFASHSYDLHRTVIGNPQGNAMPSAVTREYRVGSGYEDAASYRARLDVDARRISALLTRELGRAPRAWIWPYGRYSEDGIAAVKAAGFQLAMTLDAGIASALQPLTIPRQYPGADVTLTDLVSMLRLDRRLPAAQRLACLDPGALWTGDYTTTDERLGKAIERLRVLGATAVVIDATTSGPDGTPAEAWFPTTELPVRADILSRLVWQLQTRGGVEAYVRLSSGAAQRKLQNDARVHALFRDLGANVSMAGLLIDDATALALARTALPTGPFRGQLWETQAARDGLDLAALAPPERLAMQSFRETQRSRPWMNLALLIDLPGNVAGNVAGDPDNLGKLADLTLIRADAATYSAQNAAAPFDTLAHAKAQTITSRRSGLWFASPAPPPAAVLSAATRRFQQLGGSAIGWCADAPVANLPVAAEAAPGVSAATFPVRF